MSWSDSLGISQTSLVFTDRSASLGMPRLQLPIKRQHSPAARSKEQSTEKRKTQIETRGDKDAKNTQTAGYKNKHLQIHKMLSNSD